MSLRTRLLILVIAAMLVPAILVGLRFVQNRTSEISAALINLSATANDISSDLNDKIQGTAQLHYGLARARDLDTRDKEACSAFLSEVREEYRQFTGILTINPDGSLFCDSLRTNRTLDLRDRTYFKQALTATGVVTLEPVFGRLTGISVLQIAYPVRSESSALKFILLASFNLKKFAEYHAVVRRLDNDADALRFQDVINGVGNLRRHLFLNLQAAGIDVDNARQLADADHAAVWNVGHPNLADDRRHVMLAMALETNATQYDHLVIAFDLFEGLFQDIDRVLCIACEEFLQRARYARRRLDQAVPFGIFARPPDDGANRRLDLGSARSLDFGQRRSCAIQCMYG